MKTPTHMTCVICGETKPLDQLRQKKVSARPETRIYAAREAGYIHLRTCRACHNKKNNEKYHSTPLENALRRARVMNTTPRVKGLPPIDVHAVAQRLVDAEGCVYCAYPNDGTIRMVFDHEMPLALGGGHTLENIVIACAPCNGAKGAMHPDDYRAWLEGVRSRAAPPRVTSPDSQIDPAAARD